MRGALLGLSLALCACGETVAPAAAPTPSAREAAPSYDLTCAAFAEATSASLGRRFGEANVSVQTLPGPEGIGTYQATVLFADDPQRRIEIVWNDATDHPASVTIDGAGGQWSGPLGVKLGAPLASVEAANGRAFSMSGFDWDYGGMVTDWHEGALAHEPCHLSIGFTHRSQDGSALGDAIFESNSVPVRRADAIVSRIALGFPDD